MDGDARVPLEGGRGDVKGIADNTERRVWVKAWENWVAWEKRAADGHSLVGRARSKSGAGQLDDDSCRRAL